MPAVADGSARDDGCAISLVIPVHNTRRYLDRCIGSVMGQGLASIEIIAVDDASTDGSRELLADLRRENGSIKVIVLPENVGQGPARNRGIAAAQGRYVGFLDSDDMMAPGSLGPMIEIAERDQVDIVFGLFDRYRERPGAILELEAQPTTPFASPLRCTNVVANPDLVRLSACWQGIYRRTFLAGRQLTFARRHYEDFDFLLACIVQARSISLRPEPYIWNIARWLETDGDRSLTQRGLDKVDLELLLDQFKRVKSILAEETEYPPDQLARARHIVMRRYLERFTNEILPAVAKRCPRSDRDRYHHEIAVILGDHVDAFVDPDRLSPKAALVLELLLRGAHDAVDDVVTSGAIDQADAAELLISQPHLRGVLPDLIERSRSTLVRKSVSVPAVVPPSIRRTILHIGAPKTGSTHIQNFLELNRARLLAHNVLYPKSGIFREAGIRNFRTAGHEALVKCVNSGELTPLLDYRREIEAAGNVDTVVFSAENLFSLSPSAAAGLLAKALANTPTTVVVYLRRQDEWIESMYVERIAGGHWRTTTSFAEFLRESEAAGILDYAATLDRWADRFGAENVLVRSLDEVALGDGGAAGDFLRIVALDGIAGLVEPATASSNRFFGDRTDVELLRFFNRLTFDSSEHYFEFIGQYYAWRVGQAKAERPQFLDQTERGLLLERCRTSNARIAQIYLNGKDNLFPAAVSESSSDQVLIPASHLEAAFVFYHNSRFARPDTEAEAPSENAETPAPEIVGFGPNPVKHLLPFNQQPNGASAIWVKTAPAPAAGDGLVLGDKRLRTVLDRDVLTAEVPAALFLRPAKLALVVETTRRGGARMRSRPVEFVVE